MAAGGGGANARGVVEVFEGDGDAVEDGAGRFERAGLGEGLLGGDGDEGVEGGVELIDAAKTGFDKFGRGELAAAEEGAGFGEGEVRGVGGHGLGGGGEGEGKSATAQHCTDCSHVARIIKKGGQMTTAWLVLLLAVKLYLKDGGYQMAREYQVQEDRVRYYSTERGEWEEIPLDLVDLKKTKAEEESMAATRKETLVADAAEDAAEREQARQIARVPMNAGIYWVKGQELVPLKQAETKVVNNRRRSILKALSPLPMVSGKATLETDGPASINLIRGERPEFFMRLSLDERFGLVKLTLSKEQNRIVERWTIVPVSKELIQEHDDVETFRQQVDDGLYKIWPQKTMAPGEYAFIQWTEGKGNTQVWDFTLKDAVKQ